MASVDRSQAPAGAPDVVLFADTFNNYFESENARAALRVLQAAGYKVHVARAPARPRPLCCGRTYLASGLVDQAKAGSAPHVVKRCALRARAACRWSAWSPPAC
jgi:Fe-S oxidoreductase